MLFHECCGEPRRPKCNRRMGMCAGDVFLLILILPYCVRFFFFCICMNVCIDAFFFEFWILDYIFCTTAFCSCFWWCHSFFFFGARPREPCF